MEAQTLIAEAQARGGIYAKAGKLESSVTLTLGDRQALVAVYRYDVPDIVSHGYYVLHEEGFPPIVRPFQAGFDPLTLKLPKRAVCPHCHKPVLPKEDRRKKGRNIRFSCPLCNGYMEQIWLV